MTILESLRERKEKLENGTATIEFASEAYSIIRQYDLALENALLKLKNRAVQIKDLTHRANNEAGNLNEPIGKVLAWVENEEKGKKIIDILIAIQSRLRK